MQFQQLITWGTLLLNLPKIILSKETLASPSLTYDKATNLMKDGVWFIKLYSPTCKYCKQLEPLWEKFTQDLQPWGQKVNFHFAEVNCSQEPRLCSELRADGYPTLNVFNKGKYYKECIGYEKYEQLGKCVEDFAKHFGLKTPKQYSLEKEREENQQQQQNQPSIRNQSTSSNTVQQQTPSSNQAQPQTSVHNSPTPSSSANQSTSTEAITVPNPEGKVIILTSKDFEEKTSEGAWFIKFYAPWCSHCQKLAPTWEELATKLKGKANIAQLDCDSEKDFCKNLRIRGYPTLRYLAGNQTLDYSGSRELDPLYSKTLYLIGPKATISSDEIKKLVEKEEVATIYYNPKNEQIPKFIKNILYELTITLKSFIINEPYPGANQFKLGSKPTLLLIKDGSTLTYTGSISNPTELLNWYEQHKHPMVLPISFSDLKQILNNESPYELKDHYLVTWVLKPDETILDHSKNVRDLALPYLNRNTDKNVRFSILETNENPKLINNLGLNLNSLPKLVIIDVNDKKVFNGLENEIENKLPSLELMKSHFEKLDKKELKSLSIDFRPKFFSWDTFTSTPFLSVLIPVILLITLVYYFISSEDSDERDKKAI